MRYGHTAGAALATLVSVALLLAVAASVGAAGGPPASTVTLATTTTSVVATTVSTTTTTPTIEGRNPFSAPVTAAYLRHRTNVVTAAVYDVKSGDTYTYHNGIREETASMVKIDILADLLYESQHSGTPLSAAQQSLAESMIDDSNNHSASVLWAAIGGRDAIDSFNALIGFKQTIPSYSWGDVDTTPLDQLQLLKVIALPNAILDNASRDYEMDLMEDVISSERFGLGWGSPARALVGLKDGYYLEKATGWQLNTTGFVKYQGRFYLVTIMCAHNPDEEYGISTVTQLSSFIWKFLKP